MDYTDFDKGSFDPATPVYLMIYPSAEDVAEMRQITSEVVRSQGLVGGDWQRTLHVTLGLLGPWDKVKSQGLTNWIRACEKAAGQSNICEVEFDRVVGSGRHLLLTRKKDNEELREFWNRLVFEMMKERCKFDKKFSGFHPHVTILHHQKKMSCSLADPSRWKAEGFRLVLSTGNQSGHQTMARWNFGSFTTILD